MATLDLTKIQLQIQVIVLDQCPGSGDEYLSPADEQHFPDGLVAIAPIRCARCGVIDMPGMLKHADPWTGAVASVCRHCGELTVLRC
jgi:hypothetical protein